MNERFSRKVFHSSGYLLRKVDKLSLEYHVVLLAETSKCGDGKYRHNLILCKAMGIVIAVRYFSSYFLHWFD